jgi:hypothetical protein
MIPSINGKRLAIMIAIAGMLIAGIIGAGTRVAMACDDLPNSHHCYAIGEITRSDNHGMYGSLYVHCLATANPSGDFANQEIWTTDDNSHWVEIGVKDGLDASNNTHMQAWFWADSRPGDGYNEHFIGSQVTLDTNHEVKIIRNGTDNWNVYGGNSFHQIGTSTSNNFTATRDDAGTEYTTDQGSGTRDAGNVGKHDALNYIDPNNNPHAWGTSGYTRNFSPTSGENPWITGTYHDSTSYEDYAVC